MSEKKQETINQVIWRHCIFYEFVQSFTMRIKIVTYAALLFLMVVICQEANAASVTLFQDDFNDNVLGNLWTPYGSDVTESDGMLKMNQNRTDAGGNVYLSELNLKSQGLITMDVRSFSHYANNNFFSSYIFYGIPEDDALPESSLFAITHNNHSYYSTYGFGFADYEHHPNEESALTTAIWNEWVNERITYDPKTGVTTYSLNGMAPISYQGTPFSSDSIRLRLDSYGWYTGHYVFTDDLRITQDDGTPEAAPVPEPATMFLLGSGLIGFAGMKGRRR